MSQSKQESLDAARAFCKAHQQDFAAIAQLLDSRGITGATGTKIMLFISGLSMAQMGEPIDGATSDYFSIGYAVATVLGERGPIQ